MRRPGRGQTTNGLTPLMVSIVNGVLTQLPFVKKYVTTADTFRPLNNPAVIEPVIVA